MLFFNVFFKVFNEYGAGKLIFILVKFLLYVWGKYSTIEKEHIFDFWEAVIKIAWIIESIDDSI